MAHCIGQLALAFGVTTINDQTRFPTTPSRGGMSGTVEPAQEPVDCPMGCQGTTQCFCGQGELSDDPLWIETDDIPIERARFPRDISKWRRGSGHISPVHTGPTTTAALSIDDAGDKQ